MEHAVIARDEPGRIRQCPMIISLRSGSSRTACDDIKSSFTDRHLHTRPRTPAETRSSFIRKEAVKAATDHRTCTKKTETKSTAFSQSGQETSQDQSPETCRPSTRRHRAEQPWLTNPTSRLFARAPATENPQQIHLARNRWQLRQAPESHDDARDHRGSRRNTATPPPRETNAAFSLARPLTRTKKRNIGGRRKGGPSAISRSDARSRPLPPRFPRDNLTSTPPPRFSGVTKSTRQICPRKRKTQKPQERNRGEGRREEARRRKNQSWKGATDDGGGGRRPP
ncbi:LOW QUALITY PROTEIN: hypothetical protein YC2023_102855 [Brassica napus]